MMHGGADGMVPSAWGEKTASDVKQLGGTVEWKKWPGLAHDMQAEELLQAQAFIIRHFSPLS